MTDDICDDCNGTGQEILKVPLHDGGHMIYELEDPAPCETCGGKGHLTDDEDDQFDYYAELRDNMRRGR